MGVLSFLLKVSEEYSLAFHRLQREDVKKFGVNEVFIDSDKLIIADTPDFKRFLRQHEIEIVTHNHVVSYLKSVEMKQFCSDVNDRLDSSEQNSAKRYLQNSVSTFQVLEVITVLAFGRIIFR